ncbi:probable disease resistance protein RF45 [Coffea eugenioides]|uniref:probable disease resistance protein RF45 n=1 Tax=Coffea eugenioides TaxID=49369 RepID=UPI000F607D21|nr:probable disease resistance protein RF45 [Coffea eugenioides]
MAESLSSILTSALQNIGKLVIEEGKFLQGVSEQVSLLRDDLKWIQMFLRYADTKQTARDAIQQWLPEFRVVAYEASDLVEDYALRVSISSNRGFTRALKRTACIAREGYALHDLGLAIQSLRTRISNLTKNFGRYVNLIARTEEGESSAPSRQQQLGHTYSVVADEDVVELPDDVQVLVDYLLNEVAERKISVASIFGMGGIGKTTLARKVYHHERLKHYFKGFAWVCVSQQWQPKDLLYLNRMVIASFETGRKLGVATHEIIEGEKCVDGFSMFLTCYFLIFVASSWILEYRKACCVVGSELKLDDSDGDPSQNGELHLNDDSSDLDESFNRCEDLGKIEELGKEMLKYCGGLPLAVVVLGGILRTKKTLKEWNEVHENIKSYLARGEKIGKEGEVQKILAYSYYDLPWQLKPSIRCMVEIKEHEEGKLAVTRFESCRLHDLMRDLCLAKAKEENLYKLVDRSPSRDCPPATEAQYGLVLHLRPEDIFQYNFPPKEQTKHLRSFLCDSLVAEWGYFNPGVRIMSQVKNLKMLRVLTILSFNMASRSCYLKSPMKYVGNLIHLRCLRLGGRRINLPYSLGNLKCLETLDLSGSDYTCRIPNVLWKLKGLIYLYLPAEWGWWESQPKLRFFKANVYKNLKDLEHIINHVSKLDCIRISSLTINDFDFRRNRGLDVLSRVLFSRNIHELEINGNLCKKLPDYQSHIFPDLTELRLFDTNIEEDPMATLEKHPNLRKLILGQGSFLGQEMICHSMGFPQLKLLGLFQLGYLKQWKVDEGAMPKLSTLDITACKELEMIPDGLRYVTTLKKVSLWGMHAEFNNRVIKENGQQGEDNDKISHVPSVNISSAVLCTVMDVGFISLPNNVPCPASGWLTMATDDRLATTQYLDDYTCGYRKPMQ